MNTKNLISRRLFSGIMLIIVGIVSFLASNSAANNIMNLVVDLGYLVGAYRFLAIISITFGIIFCIKSTSRPKKLHEYTMVIIALFTFIMTQTTKMYDQSTYLPMLNWTFLIVFVIGMPTKKGFKNMPYVTKNDPEITNKSPKNANNQENLSDELRDLKQLLEENVITQEEFDAKKKQILKI